MICRPAEASFQKGQRSLSEGRILEAQAYFEASMNLHRKLGEGPMQPRYLSYYALCLSRQQSRLSEAKSLCESAADAEPYNPELWLNLARVCASAKDRAGTYRAVMRGLETSAGHGGLLDQLRQLGVRRRPFFPFLSRDNALNVIAGKIARRLR